MKPITYRELGNCGRVGNQFWQVASTVGIARAMGTRVRFREDWDYRPFLSCPDEWFGNTDRLISSEQLAPYLEPPANLYLQDYGLWRDVDEEIREAFTPNSTAQKVLDDEWKDMEERYGPYCGIHVRRGDYVTNPPGTLNALPLKYYEDALKSLPASNVIVFSDDPEWCEDNIPYADTVYRGIVRPLNNDDKYRGYNESPALDWIDIFLMARCDHHIISNSSYSWWSAWYARSEARYPSEWTGFPWWNWRTMILPEWVEIGV